MFLLQLKVVIWKNFIIRKRHWLLTIVESLLPILLFLLIAYGRSKITGLNKIEVTDVTYNPSQVIQYSDLDVSETKLYFTPNTEFYQDVMKRVQVKFQMYNNNVKGFPSSESLLQYYASHHNNTVIAIIFNEDNKKNNLDYIMRVHQDYYTADINTAEFYKHSFNFEPGTGTPYYYKGYLSIQKALDISFIEKMSGKDVESNVTLWVQEFPYPPHKEDSALTSMFLTFLPIITLFSFIFISPAVLKRVVEEKYSGIKELLKMVGMKPWMIWLGWFIYGMIPMLFSIFCIVLLMKVPFFGTEYPPIENTDGSILFVFLLLYCMAATVFCFAISSLFYKPSIAVVAGVLVWILSYFVPKYGLGLEEMGTKLSWNLNMTLNLFPNMALHYGYLAISGYEQRDLGLQWNNFYQSSSGGTEDVTMLNVFVMLIVDVIFYMAFTLYMDGLNPGKYGVRRSVLFPIYPLRKWIRGVCTVEDKQAIEPLRTRHMEEGKGMEKGIEIQGLMKRYGHKQAVNNLSLDIYQNQITVLLGPNGAGKSTTMSIITGMLDMTSGSIRMNGKDIKHNMDEIRQSLGLCPQHNLLFTDLTVGEHLLFFAKLKGKTAQKAEEEMLELLEKLNLSEKKDAMACTLSGGMKRKLCLGMAIIGGSEVLILDEPTSGMDPESRRELWDLLLAWRREKTILITTHFMEEADALGDWIAIMANGALQCHGTPMGLKKKYDTGYHLSLMVEDDATTQDKKKIQDCITKNIDTAELKDCNGNNMVFLLPLEDNSKIARLLATLENNKECLKIENISVTVTTLEDIFLKVKKQCEADSKDTPALDPKDTVGITSDSKRLLKMRIIALIVKKCKFFWKKIWNYIIPAVIAVVFMVLTLYLSGNVIGNYGDNGPEVKLQLGTYKHTTAFYNGTKQSDVMDTLKAAFRSIVEANHGGRAVEALDVQQEIVNEGIENIVYYKTHLVASAEFLWEDGSIQATALYNAIAIHSAPISLNLITNAIAKAYLGDDYSITTSNWPLENINTYTTQEYSKDKVRLLWSVIMPIGLLLLIGSFIVFPHIELSTNFTQLQFMCGVKPYWYWLVSYLVDFIWHLITALSVGIAALMVPYINGTEFLYLLCIFFIYGAASIPVVYLFSRKKSVSAGFAVFVITGIFFGIICTVSVQGLMELEDDYYSDLGHTLKVFFILALPQVGLAHSVMLLSGKAIENYNWDVMPRIKHISICMQQTNPCCDGKTAECEAYQSYAPLLRENLVLMLASCLIYLTINIVIDLYCVKKCFSWIQYELSKIRYRNDGHGRYKNIDEKHKKGDCGSLKAKNLQKTYSGKQIVKNIDFTLKEKECLGILGVNGAGKTTTFRMLTREEVVHDGNVVILDSEKKPITIDQDEYLENLGYCPQIDALNFVLTGRQILTLIAELRGVHDTQIVDKFLKLFELEEYADMSCGYYSGGNKRKLSLAVALIGFPKFVLLDEPTNGVDPSSRRKFWNLIKDFKEKKELSFILTSHSMVECEALCNNLKIMKDGRFEKEGTISELKKDHGGFNIKLKLLHKDDGKNFTAKEESIKSSSDSDGEGYDEVDSIPVKRIFKDVNELKEYFQREYGGTVKDEHSGMLHICVNDKSKNWSTIFNELEDIKTNNLHLIEDYAISEASLEDIFLTVARSKSTVEEEGKPKKKRRVRTGNLTV